MLEMQNILNLCNFAQVSYLTFHENNGEKRGKHFNIVDRYRFLSYKRM